MARPKGSKNKKAPETAVNVEQVDELIAGVNAEIDKLSAELKDKKNELRKLLKAQQAKLKAEAEKKAAEDKAAIMAAVESSGKSVEEILEFLK